MAKLKEVRFDSGSFVEGETAKVLPVELLLEDGVKITGLGKIYGEDARFNAIKEENILRTLADKNLGAALVLDVRKLSEFFPQEGTLIVETKVPGETLAEIGHPQPLDEVQAASKLIFDQLATVGSDSKLIEDNQAFCGDISTSNVVESPKGYSIVDWSGMFGLKGGTELTQGYIAPEIFDENGEGLRFVQADTFSLATLLARVLVGRNTFRELVPRKPESAHLTYEQITELVPPVVHAFFKIALEENPRKRSPEGAKNPEEHYKRLKSLFLGEQ